MTTALIRRELKHAKEKQTALEEDLPRFHSLLTDNEREHQRLKGVRDDLDALARARSRVETARELLEQHQEDIKEARAEVSRLEVELERAETIAQMAACAAESKRHREQLEAALKAGNKALLKYAEQIDAAQRGMYGARHRFLELGGTLVPLFRLNYAPVGWDHSQVEAQDQEGRAILEEIQAQGVDVSEVLTPRWGDMRRSDFDLKRAAPIDVPEPFGGRLLGAADDLRQQRHEQKKREEVEAARAAREAEEAKKPKLAELRIHPGDEGAVSEALGDLIQDVKRVNGGMRGTKNFVAFFLRAEDAPQAEELIKPRMGWPYEVINPGSSSLPVAS